MSLEQDILEWTSEAQATFNYNGNDHRFAQAVRAFLNNRDLLQDFMAVVRGWPQDKFDEEEDYHSELIPRTAKCLYFPEEEILIFTMPGQAHEKASEHFGDLFAYKLGNMDCYFGKIDPYGRATSHLTDKRKEPDKSWGPHGANYPTFVVETAMSQSLRSLEKAAATWLEHVESHVTQVLTLKLYYRTVVNFRLWRQVDDDGTPRAAMDQEVSVRLEDGRPVADGELKLSLGLLLESPQSPGREERYVIFSRRELGGIARLAWETLELIPREQ